MPPEIISFRLIISAFDVTLAMYAHAFIAILMLPLIFSPYAIAAFMIRAMLPPLMMPLLLPYAYAWFHAAIAADAAAYYLWCHDAYFLYLIYFAISLVILFAIDYAIYYFAITPPLLMPLLRHWWRAIWCRCFMLMLMPLTPLMPPLMPCHFDDDACWCLPFPLLMRAITLMPPLMLTPMLLPCLLAFAAIIFAYAAIDALLFRCRHADIASLWLLCFSLMLIRRQHIIIHIFLRHLCLRLFTSLLRHYFADWCHAWVAAWLRRATLWWERAAPFSLLFAIWRAFDAFLIVRLRFTPLIFLRHYRWFILLITFRW